MRGFLALLLACVLPSASIALAFVVPRATPLGAARVAPLAAARVPELRRPSYDFARSDIDYLRADVARLERLVVELCGALVFSDDLAVLERTSAALGPIYRDGNFSEVRRPVFTRRAIETVLAARGLTAAPPVRSWRTLRKTEDDEGR